MTKSKSLKPPANRGGHTACSLRIYALAVFARTADPDRKPWCAPDLRHAKHIAGLVAGVLAAKGPKAFDDPVMACLDVEYDLDQLPAFTSESGGIDYWWDSLAFVSKLNSILMAVMCSRQKDDARIADMFETLGMLRKLQARIVKVLETTA